MKLFIYFILSFHLIISLNGCQSLPKKNTFYVKHMMYACGDNCPQYQIINTKDNKLTPLIGKDIFVSLNGSEDSLEYIILRKAKNDNSKYTINHYTIKINGEFKNPFFGKTSTFYIDKYIIME